MNMGIPMSRARSLGILVAVAVVLLSATVVGAISAPSASAANSPTDGATRGGDNLRTGWYPDQAGLNPGVVKGGAFGRLFDTKVNGSVYGQPLLDDGQLLVNTENNDAYGLNPVTGAVL